MSSLAATPGPVGLHPAESPVALLHPVCSSLLSAGPGEKWFLGLLTSASDVLLLGLGAVQLGHLGREGAQAHRSPVAAEAAGFGLGDLGVGSSLDTQAAVYFQDAPGKIVVLEDIEGRMCDLLRAAQTLEWNAGLHPL